MLRQCHLTYYVAAVVNGRPALRHRGDGWTLWDVRAEVLRPTWVSGRVDLVSRPIRADDTEQAEQIYQLIRDGVLPPGFGG